MMKLFIDSGNKEFCYESKLKLSLVMEKKLCHLSEKRSNNSHDR